MRDVHDDVEHAERGVVGEPEHRPHRLVHDDRHQVQVTVVVGEEVVERTGATVEDPAPFVVEPRETAADVEEQHRGNHRGDADHQPRVRQTSSAWHRRRGPRLTVSWDTVLDAFTVRLPSASHVCSAGPGGAAICG